MISEIQNKSILQIEDFFNAFEQQLNGETKRAIHQIRSTAAKRMQELSFPTRRDEDYKYTSFTRITNQEYSFPAKAKVDASTIAELAIAGKPSYQIVFVNGIFQEDLSNFKDLPAGLTITTIANALENEDTRPFAEKHLNENAQSDNPFVVMNTAFAEGGIFVHLAKNTQIEQPIHFIHVNTENENPYIFHPQRLFEVEQGAELSVVDSFEGQASANYFANVVNVFHVHANAHVYHYKLQTESKEAFQVNNTTAYQEQDSTYTNLALDLGGRIVRNNLSTIHQGQNIVSNLFGAFMATGNQHIDHQTFIDHAVPNCESHELYKGVLDDKGQGVFNGKVMVRKDAQKTNAYQQNAALVLSDKATMNSKPQLEIYADDVKCSHGATIGQLDQMSMFYLRSRGMSEKMAKETLQYAFLIDVLEEVKDEIIKAKAEALIYQKFGK